MQKSNSPIQALMTIDGIDHHFVCYSRGHASEFPVYSLPRHHNIPSHAVGRGWNSHYACHILYQL